MMRGAPQGLTERRANTNCVGRQLETGRAATPSVAIVGAGFGGLCLAIQLVRAGRRNFTIFERGHDVGGTWRENTYPGAACDIPSHLYSFSFEPNPGWARAFAGQAEILDYLRRCVRKYGLRPHIRFGTEVRGARFDEERSRWVLDLGDAGAFEATVFVSACGQLNQPVIPNIAGRERFAGPAFHSARWRHDFVPAGKRIAVIGTGASAVQIVPELARDAATLVLFQRSAPYVIPKPDRAYRAAEKWLFGALPLVQRLNRTLKYVAHESRVIAFSYVKKAMWLARKSFEKHLAAQVPDPHLRRKLTPDYAMGCKRIMISNDYYPALGQPNVEVVTEPIERITDGGIVTADGRERPFDAIVYATGFATSAFLAPMRVVGGHGIALRDAWRGGAEAYLGVTVSGFPNFFILYGPNTNLGHNSIVYMLECQVRYVMDALATLERKGLTRLEVRPAVQARFNERLRRRLAGSVWADGCSSWYIDGAGKNANNWPDFTFAYRRRTNKLDLRDYLWTRS
jgi:cation diffusion facilitator CzcD-associated flavoprotein CzcO